MNDIHMETQDIVKELKFNKDGLIPAIIQDIEDVTLLIGDMNSIL